MTYDEDYIKVINGKAYIKWPILIVENTYPESSTLGGMIAIPYDSGIYFTIGIGLISKTS